MVENNPMNMALPDNAERTSRNRNENRRTDHDGDTNMTGLNSTNQANKPIGPAKQVLVEEKPIKIYPFSVDKQNEGNARYWFHVIKQQLRTQYALQAIQLYAEVGQNEYIHVLETDAGWNHADMKASMIIEAGLTSSTIISTKCHVLWGSRTNP